MLNMRVASVLGLVFVGLLACLPTVAQAQRATNLDDVQIIFEKNKEIVLPQEDKPVTNRQQGIKQDTTTRDYRTIAQDLFFPAAALEIKPKILAYTSPEEQNQKQNYLRLGLGNYLTSHIEAFYRQGAKNDYVAAKLLHFNSALGSEKWQASGTNHLQVFGTYKAFKGRIKANLLVENNRNTLYGAIPTTADGRSDIRIANVRTGFDVAYTYAKSQKYDFDLALEVLGITSFNEQRSYFARASPRYTHILGKGAYWAVQPTLAINTLAAAQTKRVVFFDTKLEYKHVLDKFSVRPWLKVLVENDSIDKKNVHIYPGLEVAYALLPNMQAFASASGDYSQNLFYNQAKENPWLGAIDQFSYLNMPIAAMGGLKGSTKNLSYELAAGVRQYKNYTAFAPSLADSAWFYALNFRGEAVNLTFLSVSGTYRQNDQFSIESGFTLQGANTSFAAAVPNIPALVWRLAPAVRVQNWVLIPAFVFKSSYDVLTPRLGTQKSGAVADIGAKVTYNLSHRLNINLDVYNLANNKALLYYGYRQRGAMGVIGGTFKF